VATEKPMTKAKDVRLSRAAADLCISQHGEHPRDGCSFCFLFLSYAYVCGCLTGEVDEAWVSKQMERHIVKEPTP
jgi:hypothetical protein